MNCAIVCSEYRPMALQEELADPERGERVASGIPSAGIRAGGARYPRGVAKVTDSEFDNLWAGISRDEGHKLAHLLIRYNAERDVFTTSAGKPRRKRGTAPSAWCGVCGTRCPATRCSNARPSCCRARQ